MNDETYISSTSSWPLKDDDYDEYYCCNKCYYPIAKEQHIQLIPFAKYSSKIIFGYKVNIKNLINTEQPPNEVQTINNKIYCFECCSLLTYNDVEREHSSYTNNDENTTIIKPENTYFQRAIVLKAMYLQKSNNK